MAFCYRRKVKFSYLVLLYVIFVTITVSSGVHLDDIIYGRVKHVPLKRTKPNGKFGFVREADFERFDKELIELHKDRVKRNAEDTVRQKNRLIIDEFELKGDNHTVAFLHWAGKQSSVIYIYTCGQINHTESDHTLCEDAYFWRSTDYGTTFRREDDKFKRQTINSVDFCQSNNKKVIVSTLNPKALYISSNQGQVFIEIPVSFKPHVISCNPLSDLMVVAHDMDSHKVYYSTDGGMRWGSLAENVLKHYWGYGTDSEIFLEVQKTNKIYTSVLKHAELNSKKSIEPKAFDESLGNFMEGSFEVAGRYMFVQKDLPTKGLYVFYKDDSTSPSSQNFFQRAQFPLQKEEEREYKVVDTSENEMMVVVKHGDAYYNLYVSDKTGVKFSLSLKNILSNRTDIWGKHTTLVDIHKVRSLNGTYLANVVIENRYVRSVITYNKGGEWHPLEAPLQDHKGVPTHCYLPACSLHIHIVLSQWHYYIPGVLSSPSAVGIIIAQGNLGNSLGQGSIGVFMSSDGGLTWTKEFDNFYDFVIGDHGGILAAVSLWRGTKEVWYSCTEGKAWKNVSLKNRVRVFGMVTEPGETKLIVNLFGQYAQTKFQWLSVKLNFTTVLNQKCLPENYTLWSPNDERAVGQCLLGQHIVYERRKSGDCCFNGEEYERKINVTVCSCGVDDFDCDLGFEHHELDEVCFATASANPVPDPCPEGKTYKHSLGYRKVVGDHCEGGVEETLKPQTRSCPIASPGDMNIKLASDKKAVATKNKVTFKLTQHKGSTKTTHYSWDFGDGSSRFNATGLSNAGSVPHTFEKNGQFSVTVTAVNNAGDAVVSTDVTVLDPITSVEIDPPHAVVVGEEAWFNITLYTTTTHGPALDEYKPSYGYVHFMWTFENITKPMLTWDLAVSHTFSTSGRFEISVKAISAVAVKDGHVSVDVYEDLTTVRLSFDVVLDSKSKDTKQWRSWLAKHLQDALRRVLDIDPSRLEVVVLSGLPTEADVSITPAPTNFSKTREEIVALMKEKVTEGAVEIHVSDDLTARITHVEVLPGRGHAYSVNDSADDKSGNTPLLIAISIAASLVVIFLVLMLVYFLRRYNRLQSRYTHLRLYSDGAQLRDTDPLVGYETETEDEQALHPQPGGSLRYVPIPTSTEPDPESDEELIDNSQPGTLVVMPMDQNEKVQ